MKAALQNYHTRMERVLDYIDRYLDGDLDLETVSRVAAFSKFHFHRQFAATFGLSAHRYVQLARMRRASRQLAWYEAESVTDIAMDAGYDTPDAFARAFRQRFEQSPSSFRKLHDWAPWFAAFGPLGNASNKLMQIIFTPDDVTIRDMPPTPMAITEHRGDRATLGTTIERFKAWCKAANLSPETGRPSFMVFRSERCPANPADYSMDLCVGTDQPIEANDERMKAGVTRREQAISEHSRRRHECSCQRNSRTGLARRTCRSSATMLPTIQTGLPPISLRTDICGRRRQRRAARTPARRCR